MSALPLSSVSVAEMAATLFEAGVLAFPAKADEKHPFVKWGAARYEGGWPSRDEHAAMFASPFAQRLFLACGARSGGLVCIDFDQPTYFEQWAALLFPQLLEKLYIEQSQRSGGYHVAFKVKGTAPTSVVPARDGRGKDGKIGSVRIEVRGEGNGFVSAPSPGYQWIQGDLTDLAILDPKEYERLLSVAARFNECEMLPEPERTRAVRVTTDSELPGTRFNRENGQREVVELFRQHGYRIGRRDASGNVPITRPGASSETSGNVNRDGVLHMFSTNTPFVPSEAGKGNPYTPFAVFTWLEHAGDYAAAGKALHRMYSPPAIRVVREHRDPPTIRGDEGDDGVTGPESQGEPSAWDLFLRSREDLASVRRDGIEPPDFLVPPVLLRGRVSCIFGGPEQGKTMLMLALLLDVVRGGGKVLLLDEEVGIRETIERLDGMGASDEDLSRIFYFQFRLEGTLDEMAAVIIEGIIREGIDIVALDSISKALAAAGLDENSNTDCTKFMRAWVTPASHIHGASVLYLDHTVKVDDDGRYGRGASSKLADTDVQWHIVAAVAPTRKTRGRLVLTKKKDRTASVPGIVRFIAGGDGSGHLSVAIESTDETPGIRVHTSDGKYIVALYGTENRGMTYAQWAEATGANPNTFKSARKRLMESGAVMKEGDSYRVTPDGILAYCPHIEQNTAWVTKGDIGVTTPYHPNHNEGVTRGDEKTLSRREGFRHPSSPPMVSPQNDTEEEEDPDAPLF